MQEHEFEPLWDVVEEHLDEAEFLWEMWEHSLVAPNYTLDEVAEGPEARLWAHIDGLVVNGPLVARKLLIPALEDEEPGRVSAATMALLHSDQGDAGINAVLEVLRELPEQRRPLIRALCCAERPELLSRMRGLLKDDDPAIIVAAAEVLAFHFEPLGETLGLLLAGDDPAARALVLRALLNEPHPNQYAGAVQAGLVDVDARIVDAAIETGARLGLAPAWARARERCEEPGGGESMLLLAVRGQQDDQAMLLRALQDRSRRLDALWALGFLGTPEAVDAALEWLEDQAAGRLAGEVFTAVTGVDLEDSEMCLDDDADEALGRHPEDDLPRPDPMAVLQWWASRRAGFADGQRLIAGAVYSFSEGCTALRRAPMRRRGGIYLDLVLQITPGPWSRLNLAGPARRQSGELVKFNERTRPRI